MMTNNKSFLWRRRFALFVMTVITANVYTTYAQSYLLTFGQNPHIYFEREIIHSPYGNYTKHGAVKGFHGTSDDQQEAQNSTVFVVKEAINSNTTELSQTAMDVITIVWYVATFMALAAFFLLMACSDRRCNSARRFPAAHNIEIPQPPPTPSPSYSEFAPPSYESVMKLENIPSIYVIPFPMEEEKENHNGSPQSVVTFYTVNELQKLGSL